MKRRLCGRIEYPTMAVVFAMGLLFLSGCVHFSPSHPYDYSMLENKQKWAAETIPSLEKEYYAEDSEDRKFIKREQVVFALMDLIDMYQYKFNSEFYGRSAGFATLGEIGAGTASATAAIIKPVGTAQILSLLSTVTLASTSSVNKNFVQNKALDLLMDRMESLRKEIKAKIIENMKKKTADYPLGQALLDVQEYARGGTIFSAVRAINMDNAKAEKQADDALKTSEKKKKE